MTPILLIDDDQKHSELLKAYLKQFHMDLDCAGDASEGFKKLASKKYELLLLDVMLPGRDGFDICRAVRRTSNIPIVILTARGDLVDRVSGLELGADDYLGKPFEPRELVARMQSILRRIELKESAMDILEFSELTIDPGSKTVLVNGEQVNLTSMEFALLYLLAKRAGKTVSRDEVLNKLRGIDAAIMTRSVDIMVSRLRQKIGDTLKPPRFIKTIWGVGYTFAAQARKDD